MPRTSNTELPSESELREILAKESQRVSIHNDCLKLHPDIFTPFKELCFKNGVECNWVDVYGQLDLAELDSQLQACFDKLETIPVASDSMSYDLTREGWTRRLLAAS